jgi:hypothetical protein
MSLVMERIFYPAVGGEEGRPNIAVLFTTIEATAAALRTAGALALRWNAGITVVAPQVVPFPRQLADPPVSVEFNEWQLAEMTKQLPVETTVAVYLCRDKHETLLSVLPAHSVVVIGARRHMWPTAEDRLAKALRSAGHEVIVAFAT